jgi:ribose transport system ATP-binding protein
VMSFADTVTVLRDGSVVGHRTVDETSPDELFQLIVGRKREEVAPSITGSSSRPPASGTRQTIRAEGVGIQGAGRSSFDVAPGEVVGLTGLLGSGFEEIPYILYGARRDAVGSLSLDGSTMDLRGLAIPEALSKGIVLIPSDRLKTGLIGGLSITENATMPQLDRFVTRGILAWRKLRSYALGVIKRYSIVASSPDAYVEALSGGNQQRVLLAKWLEAHSVLLILHEPVQGIDVAARIAIMRLIRNHAERGLSVVCASSDYEFVSAVCDRVCVYRYGTIAAELTRDAATAEIGRDRIERACVHEAAMPVPDRPAELT